jgi:hypothetical protein
MAAQIHLKAIKDAKGISTGDYECSQCGERFSPNPKRPDEMQLTFGEHKAVAHPEKKSRP